MCCFIQRNRFFPVCATAGCFLLVAQSLTGSYKDQGGHEVSAGRSDKCRERDLCKENSIKYNLVSSARKHLVSSLA